MAFLEWRRFSFFDVTKNVDNGKIAECLQDTSVSVATSGHNHMVICDVTGWAHLISRSPQWEVASFKAYELTVTLALQFQNHPYLVTIGEDEPGVVPLLKVWDWSRTDRHGSPACVRVARAVPAHLRPVNATALAATDDPNLLAVGFQDGSVVVFRGDVTRQRSGKMKTLTETGASPITGLSFKGNDKLFIVSRLSVMVYYLQSERCVTLDRTGAPARCSVRAGPDNLMLATEPAIYCYTTEGRGPCYALESEKVRLDWFRSYLVITATEPARNEAPAAADAPSPKLHNVTILDIQNKFIVFSKTFDEIDAVITEWGSFHILTKNKELIYLDEKDLQSKLMLLFKKNLYDVAIRMAGIQHYDAEGLTEIYKQYGDHLYAKGDLKGAIDQYVKTIGRLETSYVIRKYLESRHLEPLITYLEELHMKGFATEDHTTLLLTCYVKIDQHDQQGKLKQFIHSKDKHIDFDVDVAIKVVRQVSLDDALTLAATHQRHDWYLKIILEDKREYLQAIDYIAELDLDTCAHYVSKYGHRLLENAPEETTKLLILLCTDYRPRSAPLVDAGALTGADTRRRRSPDDYLHLFPGVGAGAGAACQDFLERMCAEHGSAGVYTALLDHYIHAWSKASTEADKSGYEQKILAVLRDPEAVYDKEQVLVVCQMRGFKQGLLLLYEENKLWDAAVSLHSRLGSAAGALAVCRRRGAAQPRLWLHLLHGGQAAPDTLPALLENENVVSPILVIDSLTSSPGYTLGDMRTYLNNVLKSEHDVITNEEQHANKYRTETEKMKAQIRMLQEEPVTFQSSRCAACNRTLELPSVHFMCQHSYHQHCFQSYSESESECPQCCYQRTQTRADAAAGAEAFHSRLRSQPDPYAVVSEYFGRGMFNKITVLTDAAPDVTSPPAPAPAVPAHPPPAPAARDYGAGPEAKLRLTEGQSKQVYIAPSSKPPAKGTVLIPVPEGRMRLLERQQYSSSLEANISRFPEPQVHRTSPIQARKDDVTNSAGSSPKISSAITKTASASSKNPFEEDQEYDEEKNPFAEDGQDPTNPFGDDDDYDKNLNPFS